MRSERRVVPIEEVSLPPEHIRGTAHLITWRAGSGTSSHSSSRLPVSRSSFVRGSGLGHTALYIEPTLGYPGMYISYTMGEGGQNRGFCTVGQDFGVMFDQHYSVTTLTDMRIAAMMQQALVDAALPYDARAHNCSTVAQNVLRAGGRGTEKEISMASWVSTPEGLRSRAEAVLSRKVAAAAGTEVGTEARAVVGAGTGVGTEARAEAVVGSAASASTISANPLDPLIVDYAAYVVLPVRNPDGNFRFAYAPSQRGAPRELPDTRTAIGRLGELTPAARMTVVAAAHAAPETGTGTRDADAAAFSPTDFAETTGVEAGATARVAAGMPEAPPVEAYSRTAFAEAVPSSRGEGGVADSGDAESGGLEGGDTHVSNA